MGYLVLALVAGLAAVERKGFLQAMLSRPIALAPLVGWTLGDLEGGLLVAVPLELLWLGAVNLGAALPVHEALGTAAITGGAVLAGRALGEGTSPEGVVLAVLLQSGRGGGLAGAFGGGAGSQAIFGGRGAATFLSKATTVLGVLFMLGALALGIMGSRGPSSVMGGVRGPAAPAPIEQFEADDK